MLNLLIGFPLAEVNKLKIQSFLDGFHQNAIFSPKPNSDFNQIRVLFSKKIKIIILTSWRLSDSVKWGGADEDESCRRGLRRRSKVVGVEETTELQNQTRG